MNKLHSKLDKEAGENLDSAICKTADTLNQLVDAFASFVTNPAGAWFYNLSSDDLAKILPLAEDVVIGPPRASRMRSVVQLTDGGYVGLYQKKV